jgi:cytochrome P450
MLDRLFSPKRMAALEESIADLANSCIDRFAVRGACDFSVEFANPFPAGTFLRLLGLPIEGLDEFLRMKDDVIRPGGADEDAANQSRQRAGAEISTMFQMALAEREAESRDDLLTHLVGLERQGDLTRAESINICYLLLLAGLDTVSGTLECAFALLARRPDLQRVMADPESIGPAVEELLRWIVTSPAQARVVTDDVTVEGVHIPKGTKVTALQATINFDPARFTDPLTLDVERSPNRHATFGVGVHRCLGSHLARIELAVALREWHRRIPSYQLPDGYNVTYTPALRGVENLQLQFAT